MEGEFTKYYLHGIFPMCCECRILNFQQYSIFEENAVRIQFLGQKFGEEESVSVQTINGEIGDIVIDGFDGDRELRITISDLPVEEERNREDISMRVRVVFERKSGTTGHSVGALYERGKPDNMKKFRYSVQLVALKDGKTLYQDGSILLSPKPRV